MSKTVLAALTSIIALGVALVVGVSIAGASESDTTPLVTTVLGFIGLAVTQILGNKATEEVRDDLRNGRIEKILRTALEKVAEDENTALTITRDSGKEGSSNG